MQCPLLMSPCNTLVMSADVLEATSVSYCLALDFHISTIFFVFNLLFVLFVQCSSGVGTCESGECVVIRMECHGKR